MPRHTTTWALSLKDQGKPDEAVACFRRALELKPDYAEAHYNLGNALKDQGKLDEAVACYRRALELKPDFAEAHNNLGIVLSDQGKPDEAIACYRRALELKPDYAGAHSNLGNILKDQGKPDEAAACFRRALELKPDCAASLGSLVHALQHLCCWEDLEVLSKRVIDDGGPRRQWPGWSRCAAVHFFCPADDDHGGTTTAIRTAVGGPPTESDRRTGRSLAGRRPASPKSKITVAYLSADFYSHATARLIAELIEKHDRDRLEVFAIPTARTTQPDEAAAGRRLRPFCGRERHSHVEAAERIAADGVDILVDLKGYTKDSRTRNPALSVLPRFKSTT